MKLINLAVLAFASCILAKNVFYLDDLVAAVNNEKREPKNVVSLDALRAAADEASFDDLETGNFGKKRHLQDVLQPSAPAAPLLKSLLPQVRSISVFSGYLRNSPRVLNNWDNADSFVLIIAPTDEAFAQLSAKTGKKPWEYPQEIKNNDSDEQVIKNNLDFLIRAHISAPIDREQSQKTSVTLMSGQKSSFSA
ncbi:hypothetical protein JCM33374_g3784 [Metschnikowia sp. JCM 33374]|nr:hypothetical protein JCM33374_g3784 [Metschnikowia sp. JCM 33374]